MVFLFFMDCLHMVPLASCIPESTVTNVALNRLFVVNTCNVRTHVGFQAELLIADEAFDLIPVLLVREFHMVGQVVLVAEFFTTNVALDWTVRCWLVNSS